MKLIHERQTPYGKVTVGDSDDGIIRGLYVQGVSQGRLNKASETPQSWYIQEICDKISYYLSPPSNVLVLGGGAGIITSELEKLGVPYVDTVEQSKDIVEIAKDYFSFNPRGKVIIGDAFTEIFKLGNYDAVILDLFNGITPASGPFDFFDECLRHVKPNGHFLANLVSPDQKQYVMEMTPKHG